MVLGFSEMLDEDRPDEAIWMDEDRLVEHFEALKAKRADQANRTSEDDWSKWESGEDVETNALAEELLRR